MVEFGFGLGIGRAKSRKGLRNFGGGPRLELKRFHFANFQRARCGFDRLAAGWFRGSGLRRRNFYRCSRHCSFDARLFCHDPGIVKGHDRRNDFDEPKLFSALLTPHRSLSRSGFLALMFFLTAISFAAGMAFLLMGAWPVFGFFRPRCADRLHRLSHQLSPRHGDGRNHHHANRTEAAARQSSRACGGMGAQSAVGAARSGNPRGVWGRAALSALAREAAVGRQLSRPDEKASFAKALFAGLNAAKRGPIHNPVA